MANTQNLDLVKPLGTDHALVSVLNSNSDKIDAYAGAVNAGLDGLRDGLGILADGNTHAAITSGQFVYVKNHQTLPQGLYQATTNIAANGTLSTSNLTADPKGGLNTLSEQIGTINVPTVIYPMNIIKDSSSITLQDAITSYNTLYFIVTPDGNSARKGILTIPVSDVVTGGYNNSNQYIASVQEYSGGTWYVTFVQFYFSDSSHIAIVGKEVSGWTNNISVKILASK